LRETLVEAVALLDCSAQVFAVRYMAQSRGRRARQERRKVVSVPFGCSSWSRTRHYSRANLRLTGSSPCF